MTRALAVALVWFLGATVAPGAVSAALLGHGGPVKGIAVSADGRTAVTAGFDYSLIVWHLADESVARHLTGHDGPVNAVALTADGRTAVSASDDGTAVVWDLPSGEPRLRLEAGAKLGSVALSAGEEFQVAAGGWDGRVHRWRLADGAPLPALANGGERVTAVAFDGPATLLAGGHEGTLGVWDTRDGSLRRRLPAHDFGVTAVAALRTGGTVLTGSIDGTLRLWDPASGAPARELAGHEQPVVAAAASGDGATIASAGARGEVLLWRADDRHPHLVLAGAGPAAWALAFTPDGRRLLAGGADGAVRVWDTAAGALLGHPLPDAAPAADGRGPRLFAKCSACHTLTADGGNKAGPPLAGLFGRRAGAVAGYPYSRALRESGIVWTEDTVARLFDVGPDRYVPGTKMPLQRLPNPRDRTDLVDYLKRMGGG